MVGELRVPAEAGKGTDNGMSLREESVNLALDARERTPSASEEDSDDKHPKDECVKESERGELPSF